MDKARLPFSRKGELRETTSCFGITSREHYPNFWPLVSARFLKVVSLSGGLTFGSTLESEKSLRRQSLAPKRSSVVGRLPKALSIFGWGHPFQTIQSMPSNMPQM